MSQPLQRRVPPEDTMVYDAVDFERAVVLRRRITAFTALVYNSKNTTLDRVFVDSEDASGESASAPEVDQEVLAENVQSVLEAIKEILKELDTCNGKLASDDHAKLLPYVIAVAMCEAMKKFLDKQTIVHGALDVLAKMWDDYLLEEINDIESMPGFKTTVLTMVSVSLKLFGHAWFEQSQSWATLGNMTNVGPDLPNQVMLDRHLATARGLMDVVDVTHLREHEVVECAVLLNSVVFWHQMTTNFEDHYLKLVSEFALWLVNTFQSRDRAKQHIGVLGCQLLYHIAVRGMELGQAQDPVQFNITDEWFRWHQIPERLMLFQGFSAEGDKYIREILRRVPLGAAGPLNKRAREPSPEPGPATAAPARRGLGGSA